MVIKKFFKGKRKIAALALAALLIAGEFSPTIARASSMEAGVAETEILNSAEQEMPVKVADNYEDVLGYARQDYNGTFCEKEPETEEAMAAYSGQWEVEKYEICALTVSTSEVILRKNGCFDFVDIIGELQSGGYVNLSGAAEYRVADPGIATCSRGRVYGVNVGTTEVIAGYADYEVSFQVTVQEFIDYDAMMQELIQGNGVAAYALTTSQMSATMNRANEVVHVRWTPKKDFTMNDGTIAAAGKVLTGMPYTQRPDGRCSVSDFLTKVNTDEFYTINEHPRYKNTPTYWAQYGIDCSGFLCLSWNLPAWTAGTTDFWNSIKNGGNYEKVGTYSIKIVNSSFDVSTGAVDHYVLKEAYMSLMPGDAVVSRYLTRNLKGDFVEAGHARLVTGVNKQAEEVYMLEARNNFPESICLTFDELAAEFYCPFAIKSSYYNTYNK